MWRTEGGERVARAGKEGIDRGGVPDDVGGDEGGREQGNGRLAGSRLGNKCGE